MTVVAGQKTVEKIGAFFKPTYSAVNVRHWPFRTCSRCHTYIYVIDPQKLKCHYRGSNFIAIMVMYRNELLIKVLRVWFQLKAPAAYWWSGSLPFIKVALNELPRACFRENQTDLKWLPVACVCSVNVSFLKGCVLQARVYLGKVVSVCFSNWHAVFCTILIEQQLTD